jgi:hypothetical protein
VSRHYESLSELSPKQRALLELRLKQKRVAPPPLKISRQRREGVNLPLSFAQQRLWFIDQLEPGSALYNMPMTARLSGSLDVGALEQTLTEIVRRHESLRTAFPEVNGEPVQVINPAAPLTLPVTDLSHLSDGERETEARRIATEEAQKAFDLATGPLMRASLLRLGDEEHIILFTMHHIISDGWSMGILVREVAALYEAYSAGEESPLPELPVQYADYAYWQREWLQGEVLERQLAYWREHLSGAPAVLELPTDRPRPAVQSFGGAVHSFIVPAELSKKLKELAEEEGATLFMALLAAFQLMLYGYTGQETIAVGTNIANRTRRDIEGLIGFFVNNLVLCTNVSGNPTFRELMGRVREVCLGAYAHQDVPFDKLVEELQPERVLSHQPLFQVLFVLQNFELSNLELPGLTLSGFGGSGRSAKFDLGLNLMDTDEGLFGTLEYKTDLYMAGSIGRMVEKFQNLVREIVEHPERDVRSILNGEEDEEQQSLADAFNDDLE